LESIHEDVRALVEGPYRTGLVWLEDAAKPIARAATVMPLVHSPRDPRLAFPSRDPRAPSIT
jgi:hypothetical protein